jgi:hypothetical protein
MGESEVWAWREAQTEKRSRRECLWILFEMDKKAYPRG